MAIIKTAPAVLSVIVVVEKPGMIHSRSSLSLIFFCQPVSAANNPLGFQELTSRSSNIFSVNQSKSNVNLLQPTNSISSFFSLWSTK